MKKLACSLVLFLALFGSFWLPAAYTASSVGLTVDNIIAGTNITLTKTSTTVTVNASGGSSGGCAISGSSGTEIFGDSSTACTDAYWGKGSSYTAGQAFTMHSTDVTGTNVAGSDLTMQPGKGTGTGASGDLKVTGGYSIDSSSTAHTIADRLFVRMRPKNITANNSYQTFMTVTMPNSGAQSIGGTILYQARILTSDSEVQSCAGSVQFAGFMQPGANANIAVFPANTSGELCPTTGVANAVKSLSSGTLSSIMNVDQDPTPRTFTFQVKVNSSLSNVSERTFAYTVVMSSTSPGATISFTN